MSSEYVEYQVVQSNNPNKSLTRAHINVFWTPVKDIDLGAEYIWEEQKTFLDAICMKMQRNSNKNINKTIRCKIYQQ